MGKHKLSDELENIWYHYKPHIFIGIVVVVIGIYFVFTMLHQKHEKVDMNVVFLGNGIQTEQQEKFQKGATQNILGKSHSDSIIKTDFWPISGSLNDSQQGAQLEKLMAMMSTKQIDVLVTDKDDFFNLAQQGAFLNLSSLKPELPKGTPILAADVVTSKSTDKQRTKKEACGVLISGNKKLESIGFNTQDKVLAILSNSQHVKDARKFMTWLSQQ
ncbi:hypothetical protein JOD43_001976 [Pullulanibacillus pueri]|uniref:Uncharacterized protein n=1 Tax=Pullulanibacillus pueri TaxID=1437324 RepID=A0A8J3EKW3_9BACL|nr:hypothetical protein [Pullulanibacillus pueri]MBM7681804.1 hypothetical protein [Pullulanibacillus pueri]GGH76152.1 hypothetical protein GCM10007096_06150 [Pullulanibacillus pueri]